MNWAEIHELSESEKATHLQVRYVPKSRKETEECGNCKNLILGSNGLRCRTVQCPIAAGGWCQRWTQN